MARKKTNHKQLMDHFEQQISDHMDAAMQRGGVDEVAKLVKAYADVILGVEKLRDDASGSRP